MSLLFLLLGLSSWNKNNYFARRTLALSFDMILYYATMQLLISQYWSIDKIISSTALSQNYTYIQWISDFSLLYLSPPSWIAIVAAYVISYVLFCTIMECSSYRGTLGKILFKIIVCDRKGDQLTFGIALIRNLIKWTTITSYPLILLNSLIVRFTGKGMHDFTVRGFVAILPEGLKRKIGKQKIFVKHSRLKFRPKNHEEAGAYGETLLKKELDKLSKTIVFAYSSTDNLVYRGYNFEIDAYALVNGVGIFLLEAKFYAGVIYPTALDHWDVIKNGANSPKENPCKQLARTKQLTANLLNSYGMNKWPIYPAVVLTHPAYTIVWDDGSILKHRVMDLGALGRSISNIRIDHSIAFSRQDFDKIRSIFKKHEKEYVGS